MSAKNYAYYNLENGYIENVLAIEDDVASTLVWPKGFSVVLIPENTGGEWSTCGIGWSYIDGKFVEPTKPEVVAGEGQAIVSGAQTL